MESDVRRCEGHPQPIRPLARAPLPGPRPGASVWSAQTGGADRGPRPANTLGGPEAEGADGSDQPRPLEGTESARHRRQLGIGEGVARALAAGVADVVVY